MLRTDKTSVIFAQETVYGEIPTSGWRRFGLHDKAELPDPAFTWAPYYSIGSQNRTQIIKGKNVLEASISDIRLQTRAPIWLCFPQNDTIPLNSLSMANELFDHNGNSVLKRRYGGGRVNRATFSIKEGEELQLSLDEILFAHMTHNRPTASRERYFPNVYYPTDPGPIPNTRYTFNNITINGLNVSFTRVRSFKLSVSNNLYPYYAIKEGLGLDQTLQPVRIMTGLTEYQMMLEVDVHETELALWDYLMNQGSNLGNGPTTGTAFRLTFTNDFEPFTMHCSLGGTSTNPGMVFERADFPITTNENGGYYRATFVGNVDRVFVL